jgi:hypothetical protein
MRTARLRVPQKYSSGFVEAKRDTPRFSLFIARDDAAQERERCGGAPKDVANDPRLLPSAAARALCGTNEEKKKPPLARGPLLRL